MSDDDEEWHVNELYATLKNCWKAMMCLYLVILSSYYSQNRDISYAARIALFPTAGV